MTVSERKSSNISVIEIHGDFDLIAAGVVKNYINEHIEKNKENKLIFDFSNTLYVDSTAVGVLVKTSRTLLGKNGNVAIIHLNQNIKEILVSMNLLTLINIFDSEENAVNFLNKD